MSESIVLTLQPDRVTISRRVQYRTTVDEFENGGEYRRALWTRRKTNYTLTFKHAFELGQADLLETFFDARMGRAESFVVPSWIEDARLVASVAAASMSIGVNTVTRFHTSTQSPGNLAVIGRLNTNFNWIMQPIRISSISAANTITFVTSINTLYNPIDTYVFVGSLSRFEGDELATEIVGGRCHLHPEVSFMGVYL